MENTKPMMSTIRSSLLFIRSTGSLVILTMLSWFISPTVLAAKQLYNDQKQLASITQREKLDQSPKVMEELQAVLQDFSGETQSRGRKVKSTSKNQQKLAKLETTLNELDIEVLQDFNNIEKHINKHNLSPVIIQRHNEAVKKYKKEFIKAQQNIKKVRYAKTDLERITASDEALRYLKSFKHKRSHQPFDPKNLPFSSASGKVRKPFTNKVELAQDIALQVLNRTEKR